MAVGGFFAFLAAGGATGTTNTSEVRLSTESRPQPNGSVAAAGLAAGLRPDLAVGAAGGSCSDSGKSAVVDVNSVAVFAAGFAFFGAAFFSGAGLAFSAADFDFSFAGFEFSFGSFDFSVADFGFSVPVFDFSAAVFGLSVGAFFD